MSLMLHEACEGRLEIQEMKRSFFLQGDRCLASEMRPERQALGLARLTQVVQAIFTSESQSGFVVTKRPYACALQPRSTSRGLIIPPHLTPASGSPTLLGLLRAIGTGMVAWEESCCTGLP